MRQLLSLLFLIPCYVFCQERGIDFVENLSWQQVKEKAKQEQKYIMIDCYTSWCGPCKVMDQTTFKDPEVAKIANEGFVAVKVQFDEDCIPFLSFLTNNPNCSHTSPGIAWS